MNFETDISNQDKLLGLINFQTNMESTKKPDSNINIESLKRTPGRLSLKRSTTVSPKTPKRNRLLAEKSKCGSPNGTKPKLDLIETDDSLVNLKPLGFDSKLTEWMESIKTNPLLSNSSGHSKEELQSHKMKLHEIQADISDKFFTALNNIPEQILTKFPGYDPRVYQQLKILNQNLKARIRQTSRKMLKIYEEQSNVEKSQNTSISADAISINSSKQSFDDVKLDNNDEVLEDDLKKSTAIPDLVKDVSNNDLRKSKLFSFPKISTGSAEDPTIVAQKKKSTFQLKKPMSKGAVPPVVNVSKKLLMERNNDKTRMSVNKIGTLATSTVTSNVENTEAGCVINNVKQIKHCAAVRTEDIIKVDPNDFLTKLADSEGDFEVGFDNDDLQNRLEDSNENELMKLLEESPDTEELLKTLPDVSELTKPPVSEEFNYNSSVVKFIGDVKNDGISGEFNNLNFPHSQEMLHVFKTRFGLHQFRPNQLPAINAVILGHDCFVLMPTGGGKSLCYQLPALLAPGVTIVISPLRSLIVDQTQKLLSLDISALYLTGDLSNEQMNGVYRKLYNTESNLKLLYVTPEKISKSTKFCDSLLRLYRDGKLARFVIDEVHCVSQWGHDFRPDYKKLSMLRERFPGVPIIALTATATQRVRSDILHQLHLQSPKWFISSFNRPNLRYTVTLRKSKYPYQLVLDLIKTKFPNDCGIIYCFSRNDCDNLAEALKKEGIQALSYHAGLDDKVRTDRQIQWVSEKVKVICATIAFGMGIDKPNVRYVIHATMPKSIEGYYQESGRAGRDGEPADCILLYNYSDMHRYRTMMESNEYANKEALKTHLDNLFKIVHFCENMADCRRALQLNYFGEMFDRQLCIANMETTCDNCLIYDQFFNLDVTKDAKALVRLIQELHRVKQNNVTALQVVDIYKGSNVSDISYKLGNTYHEWYGLGHSLTKYEIERILHNLVIQGFLCENLEPNHGIVCAYLAPGLRAKEILSQNNIKLYLQKKKPPEKIQPKKTSTTSQMSAVINVELKDLEQRCYNELLEIVNGIAGALDVSANSIMNVVALRVMSQQLPCDREAMLKIPHVTEANFEKYGKALLDVTQKYAQEKKELLIEEELNNPVISDNEDDYERMNFKTGSIGQSNKRTKSRGYRQNKRFKNNFRKNATSATTKAPITSNSTNISSFIKIENRANNKTWNSKSNSTSKKKSTNTNKGNKGQNNSSSNSNKGPGLCEFTKKR
ncbi:Bloom syndrome protein homolog isoform X1 [Nasonia vitripennis]|uniref:RecQ-like DNA helicase BLM n=2 Tax=Nasonia vitripennis TaxID=7425 RepID=A0A7M7J550_NASVI|nr:Bloom syndrome protein homolog isoform X1 [Nasonia vitripennis]XP_031777644.1 Bloom syndrome protein homolog isoform X1 [Nasonia vitripennis]